MIEYVNLLLLLTMFGSTCYVYYRLKKDFLSHKYSNGLQNT